MENIVKEQPFNFNKIPNSKLIGCKITIEYFKYLSTENKNSYRQKFLKKIYKNICNITSKTNINFFITSGNIYLVPESKEGFQADLKLMINAIKYFKNY